jgi:hypothetical protein
MASLDKLEPEQAESNSEVEVLGSCSPTISLQRDRGDCLLHVLPKLIIKNVFEKVLDLKLTKEDDKKYDTCMPLTIPARQRGFVLDKCSKKGYVKIMLFYYLFSLIEISNFRKINQALSLVSVMPEDVAYSPGPRRNTYREVNILDERLFRAVKEEFLAKSSHLEWKHLHVTMDMDDFESIKTNFLEPILRLNLYIELGLQEETEDKPGLHIVLITGFDKENIHIKNTWSYPVLLKVPWGETIMLDDGKVWKITDLHTILPMLKGRDIESEYDNRNIENLFPFIAEYRIPIKGGKTRRFRSKKSTYRYRS